jgi:P-type conjugative transfer protein TrbJ
MKKHYFINYIAALSLCVAGGMSNMMNQPAHAWRASEYTQLANNALLLKSYLQQVQQVSNQITQIKTLVDQYTTMAKNTLNIPNDIWHTFAQEVAKVASIYKQAHSLMSKFSNIDNEMKRIYKNYDFFRLKQMGVADYFLQYQSWHKVNTELLQDIFEKVGLSADKIAYSEDNIGKLIDINRRSTGHQQTMQITNELLGTMAGQIGNLESIMLNQLQMQTQFNAHREQELAAEQAQKQRMHSPLNSIIGNETKRIFK